MKNLLFLLLFASFAKADNYYCILFATDAISPKYCHVWGTFLHMKDDKISKEVTISWAPSEQWNVLDRKKEGFNFSLKESMRFSNGKATCMYGPFEIDEDFFLKAERQYLSPGKYKMIDTFSRDSMNCIHRLSSITDKRLITHVRYGKFAAEAIYKHYCRLGLLYETSEGDKIINALNINDFKLRRMTCRK